MNNIWDNLGFDKSDFSLPFIKVGSAQSKEFDESVVNKLYANISVTDEQGDFKQINKVLATLNKPMYFAVLSFRKFLVTHKWDGKEAIIGQAQETLKEEWKQSHWDKVTRQDIYDTDTNTTIRRRQEVFFLVRVYNEEGDIVIPFAVFPMASSRLKCARSILKILSSYGMSVGKTGTPADIVLKLQLESNESKGGIRYMNLTPALFHKKNKQKLDSEDFNKANFHLDSLKEEDKARALPPVLDVPVENLPPLELKKNVKSKKQPKKQEVKNDF